jgi:hypothetical protein
MSGGQIKLSSQTMLKYDIALFTNADTGNNSWNRNTSDIQLNRPGLYIIVIASSPATSGGSNWYGMFQIYTDNPSSPSIYYVRSAGTLGGTWPVALTKRTIPSSGPATYGGTILSGNDGVSSLALDDINRGSGWLIGLDTNSGGAYRGTATIIINRILNDQ